MESEQFTKKLEWLDEQRKKGTESVQRIGTQIHDLEGSIATLSKQMEALSSEVSRLAAATTKINKFDEALTKHRTDISRRLEEAEKRRTKKEQQLESLRTSDQKNLIKAIDELRRELERIGPIEEQLDQRRAEDSRLNREIGELAARFEALDSNLNDRGLRILSLEESSVQESKRTNELMTDITGLKRRAEDLRNTINLVEDRTRKMEVRIADLKSSDEERSDQLEVWTDEQRMRLVDFEKKWMVWEKRFEAFEAEASQSEDKIVAYEQTHRSIKQMQSQLAGLIERLERRITEVGEMQRLSEDRMKQDWTAFEADETKKWSTFTLSSEERWKEHDRAHDKLSKALDELVDLRAEIREDLEVLLEREARRVRELVELTRQWLND